MALTTSSSRLPVFPSSRLPVFPSSRLRAAALAASFAVLAVGCGDGSDATMTQPRVAGGQTLAPELEALKTLEEREALCAEQMSLKGCDGILEAKRKREAGDREAMMINPPILGGALMEKTRNEIVQSVHALAAMKKAAMEPKGPLYLKTNTGTNPSPGHRIYGVQAANTIRDTTSKKYNTVAKVTPGGSESKISYSFDLYNIEIGPDATDTIDFNSQHEIHGPNAAPKGGTTKWPQNPELNLGESLELFQSISPSGKNAYKTMDNKIPIDTLVQPKEAGKWDYTILTASSKIRKADEKAGGMFYAEVWTNYALSSSDYLVGGVWLLTPANVTEADSYKFAAFASAGKVYGYTSDWVPLGANEELTGEYTFTGPAAGLHLSTVDEATKVSRLLGKVTLVADFGTNQQKVGYGELSGEITNLMLDNKRVNGSIQLPGHKLTNFPAVAAFGGPGENDPDERIEESTDGLGRFDGTSYMGEWSAFFTGDSPATDTAATPVPTSVGGVAHGYSKDKMKSFALSFGATKVVETENNDE